MADVREMRIFSADQIEVPEQLPQILKDFSKEVIRNNPDNLVEFCREYFIDAIKKRDATNAKAAASAAADAPKKADPNKLDIEKIGKEAAKQALTNYDTNNDGQLSKREAEPMFRDSFAAL